MANIGRASAFIAAGTLVSRLTGLVRTMVLVTAIGVFAVGDAFNTANGLPNAIYALVSAGLLTAIVVPQVVKAARNADGGFAFISKLFTIGVVGLFAITVLAMVAVPWLVELYSPQFSAPQKVLAVALGYWCVPQLFFYGVFALIGETLNARNVFGPYAWAPVVNNIVSTAGFALIIWLYGGNLTVIEDWTPDRIALLGGSATLGIAVQFFVLMLFWKRAKLRVRPDFQWRGVGLGEIVKMAGWTFLMVMVGTIGGIVQSQVVSEASGEYPAGLVMSNAWLVYMVPYSVIVLSIGTPFFTRMSEFGSAGKTHELRETIDTSIRTLGFFIVIATAVLAAGAVPASRIFTNSGDEAILSAPVLLAYLVNLIPVAILFVIQRMFYILGDTRTPFFFTLLQGVLIVASAYLAAAFLPLSMLAAGVALGQSVATIVQLIVATALLQRRFGSLNAGSWLRGYARFAIAGVVAGVAGWGVWQLLGGSSSWLLHGKITAMLGLGIIGIVAGVVYIGVLAIVRAPELSVATDQIKRFRRRSAE